MKRGILTVAALALTVVGTSTAQAQRVAASAAARPFSFGVTAGAAIPMGKSSDVANTGIDIGGLMDYRTPGMPVTVRGELTYSRFGIKDLPSDLDGHHSVLAAIANIVAPLPTGGSVAPYFIGGPGVYSVKTTVSDESLSASVSKTAMGINGGMGLNFRLGSLSSFVEARYHYVFSKDEEKGFENTQNIPLSFGIRF